MKFMFFGCLFMMASGWAMANEEIQCVGDNLLKDHKDFENMSVEVLKIALAQYNEIKEKENLLAKDKERTDKLAKLLLLIEKIEKVRIEDCTGLDIKEKTPEALSLLSQIKEHCKNSPQNIWAEITKTGQLKLIFDHGSNNGTKSITLGGGGNLTFGYRKQEIKLGSNITTANISAAKNSTSSLKYDHLLDYSIDLGISNLETFLKWQGTYESTKTPNGVTRAEASIRRNVVDLGLRYKFVSNEELKLKAGTGAGISHLNQHKAPLPMESSLSPSVVITTDMSYRPVKSAEIFIGTRLQRDVLTANPRTVAGLKSGAKVNLGPVGAGLEYSTDYDNARTGPKLNHQFMANFFASINPDDWKSEKARKEYLEAKERERLLWEKALVRVRELRAQEEAKK